MLLTHILLRCSHWKLGHSSLHGATLGLFLHTTIFYHLFIIDSQKSSVRLGGFARKVPACTQNGCFLFPAYRIVSLVIDLFVAFIKNKFNLETLLVIMGQLVLLLLHLKVLLALVLLNRFVVFIIIRLNAIVFFFK